MRWRYSLSLVAVCLLIPVTLLAQGRGSTTLRYVTNAISTDTLYQQGGMTFVSSHFSMVTLVTDGNELFDELKGDCVGTAAVAEDGTITATSGHCFFVDADGDGYWSWFRQTEAGTETCPLRCGAGEAFNGYGKFEGFLWEGTYRVVAALAGGNSVGELEGRYEFP